MPHHIQTTYNETKNVFNAPVINNYIMHTWDSKDRLVVSIDLLKIAFRENELLQEYLALPEINRLAPKFINTYVLEALMAVIRQAHRTPDCRNIRLSPDRADLVQVLVREGGERWEILTLAEAVQLLFRDAACHLQHLACSKDAQRELTSEERTASLLIPQEYHRRSERYERAGKSRLAAHLATLGAVPAQERVFETARPGAPRPSPAEKRPALDPPSGYPPRSAPPPAAELGPPIPSSPPFWAPPSAAEPGPPIPSSPPFWAPPSTAEPGPPIPSSPPFWAPPLTVPGPPIPSSPPFWAPPLTVPGPPAPPGPPFLAPARPPPFSPAAATALLREHPPALDADGRAPSAALQRLSEISGQEPSRIVNHLWEANEDGMLSPEEQSWAAALTRLHDGVD